jgi:Tol biopolymer transport system component
LEEKEMGRLSSFAALCLIFLMIACSPQGKSNYKIALVANGSGQSGIFVMNSDTTGSKILTPDIHSQLRHSSWSQDGDKIAFFDIRAEDGEMLKKNSMPSHFPLYVMDSSGYGQKRLLNFPVTDFKWSPDSRQLLYVSAYEDPQRNDPDVQKGKKQPMSAIYVLNMRTGGPRRLSSFGLNCSGDWSPDGARLALSFGNEQSSDIYVISLDGEHQRRLTDSQNINITPVWSPDGKAIAYVTLASPGATDNSGIYVLNADGSEKRKVSKIGGYEVSWSPDGKWLLIPTAADLYLASANGGNSVNLTRGRGRPLEAVFTPDGKEVAFRSNHEGEWHIYAIDLDGKKLRRITGALSASTFCFSPLLGASRRANPAVP